MIDYCLAFWPTGTYTQIYASVLLASCIITSLVWTSRRTAFLVLAVLVGWIGARWTTVEGTVIPVIMLSVAGFALALLAGGRAGWVIATLYIGKIVLYALASINVIALWMMFELSTILGLAQIIVMISGSWGGGKRSRISEECSPGFDDPLAQTHIYTSEGFLAKHDMNR